MRLVPALAIAVIVTVPAYAESLQPGLYPCRTPAGTQTGSSFVIGPDGHNFEAVCHAAEDCAFA